jgi:hypothetical protein
VFKLEKYTEDSISTGDVKYIIASFRPLTNKEYKLDIPFYFYFDDNSKTKSLMITLKGTGFHPKLQKVPSYVSIFKNMPKCRVYNKFENYIIQRCELSVEEIDFGVVDDKPISKIFILYNYSNSESFNFEFHNSGFSMKDEIVFEPPKGQVDPNSQVIIKAILIPKDTNSTQYEGEIEVRITWMHSDNSKVLDKEKLFLRILKKSFIKEVK